MAALHACGVSDHMLHCLRAEGGLRTSKASEVVDAHFIVQLEHAAQALHPPPEPILLVRLRSHKILVVLRIHILSFADTHLLLDQSPQSILQSRFSIHSCKASGFAHIFAYGPVC